MLLLFLFLIEYFSGEVVYYALDGDVFLGAHGDYSKSIDLSMYYYVAVSSIDFLVCKYLMSVEKGEREKAYFNLSLCSLLANFYGWSIYMLDGSSSAYEAILLAILILKMTLLDKALQDAGRYILDFTRRTCSSLVRSHAYLYVAEVVHQNKGANA